MQEGLPLPPPQATMPLADATNRNTIPSMERQLRRRAGMPRSTRKPKTALPLEYHAMVLGSELDAGQELVVLAVVEMVRVAVPAIAPVMFTGVVVPKLKVGGCVPPVGMVVAVAVSTTLPVKPPAGFSVIVDVLPVVAPAATVTEEPVTEKVAGRMMV